LCDLKRAHAARWRALQVTFIKAHLGVIVGMDFFTVEVVTWLGLIRYHVLFAIDMTIGVSKLVFELWRTLPDRIRRP